MAQLNLNSSIQFYLFVDSSSDGKTVDKIPNITAITFEIFKTIFRHPHYNLCLDQSRKLTTHC